MNRVKHERHLTIAWLIGLISGPIATLMAVQMLRTENYWLCILIGFYLAVSSATTKTLKY